MTLVQKLLKNDKIPKLLSNGNQIQYENNNFIIDSNLLNIFHDQISETRQEYVRPTVFTDLIKNYYKLYKKIVIPENDLYILRIWSNAYRNHINYKSNDYLRYYIYKLAEKTVFQSVNQ